MHYNLCIDAQFFVHSILLKAHMPSLKKNSYRIIVWIVSYNPKL